MIGQLHHVVNAKREENKAEFAEGGIVLVVVGMMQKVFWKTVVEGGLRSTKSRRRLLRWHLTTLLVSVQNPKFPPHQVFVIITSSNQMFLVNCN
ncbi:hypothetical protein L3X38_022785 [Prunus dulcis]|uniref:Uncharacterized protein n=1 Tax=Prunus dulcis TaxID=3755 RepID=A0AAD4VZ65_PRUDU|nr:hypothetical protein L3X38_022785 [Prunus dulcis]